MSHRELKPTGANTKLAQRYAPAALAALGEIIKNRSTSDAVRIRAVKLLLEFSGPGPQDSFDWSKLSPDEIRIVADIFRKYA